MPDDPSAGRRLPRRPFGRTGHDSSRVIFGAASLSDLAQHDADALLPLLDELGVNHLDTAAAYGDSELRLAPWLRGRRADFFLATKTGERSGAGARAQLEESLRRLGVDRVDLVQLHNLVEPEEWAAAHAPGGAVDALARAREEGLTRFVGVTGHGLRIARMHLESLQRFDFDSVLFPYNFVLLRDPGYRRDVEALRERCHERGVAMQTIKSVARRRWADGPDGHASWYEPLTDPAAVSRAVGFVLAEADLFLNSPSDPRLLRPVLEAARAPATAAGPELAADVDAQGITPLFDGSEALERI